MLPVFVNDLLIETRLYRNYGITSGLPVRTKSLARRLESGGVAKEVRQG